MSLNFPESSGPPKVESLSIILRFAVVQENTIDEDDDNTQHLTVLFQY